MVVLSNILNHIIEVKQQGIRSFDDFDCVWLIWNNFIQIITLLLKKMFKFPILYKKIISKNIILIDIESIIIIDHFKREIILSKQPYPKIIDISRKAFTNTRIKAIIYSSTFSYHFFPSASKKTHVSNALWIFEPMIWLIR